MHLNFTVHKGAPKVNASSGLIWLELQPDDPLNSVAIFFKDHQSARECGEALMREAYRAQQMEKLANADVDIPPVETLSEA